MASNLEIDAATESHVTLGLSVTLEFAPSFQAMVIYSTQSPDQSVKVPPLENGDRLTQSEFERRYAVMPHTQKAELVEGVVYMMLRFVLTQLT